MDVSNRMFVCAYTLKEEVCKQLQQSSFAKQPPWV